MILHDYQEEGIQSIFRELSIHNSVLYQCMTGAGKTVIASFICRRWIEEGRGKIVITCHRTELVDQFVETLLELGVSAQPYYAKTKQTHYFADVYVCMVETINMRLKKGRFETGGITLVISDEAHILVHEKVYKYFDRSKFIGLSATPVIMKRIKYHYCKYCHEEHPVEAVCCGFQTDEWTKPFAMSEIYDSIVVGPGADKLIEMGQLVRETSLGKDYAHIEELKTDSDGEFTAESLDKIYSDADAVFNVILNYEQFCTGKRTMIFNSSTKVNKLIYSKFIEKGYYNVRMYDSVNQSEHSRKDIVEWFKDTPDAVLLNCGVFTTGFDCKEVQAIILNRATMSLSLFLQIVGRGGRATKKIFKDTFLVIDGGANIERFGEWSSDRDWEHIFFNGIGKAKPNKVDIIDIQDCLKCGALFPKAAIECPMCGGEVSQPVKVDGGDKQVKESSDIMKPIREIPPPNAKIIYEYTKHMEKDINFAFKILYSRVRDMFIYYRVDANTYERSRQTGELDRKIYNMVNPVYLYLIRRSDIQNGANRTRSYVVNRAKKEVESLYKTVKTGA